MKFIVGFIVDITFLLFALWFLGLVSVYSVLLYNIIICFILLIAFSSQLDNLKSKIYKEKE